MSHAPHLPLTRRQMLSASAGSAAGLALLRDFGGAAENPSVDVVDKASAIRLSQLTAFPVGPKAYLKLETNYGIHGWGEITGLEPHVAATLARSVFALLENENPTRIEHLWQKVFRSQRNTRTDPLLTGVLSAIDMALWDITGKLHGVPVYRLLGGPTRDKIRMYPSVKAHKAGTGGPHNWSATPAEIERLAKMVASARTKVGPDGCVMFDAHSAVPPPMLIQLAAAIQPYDVLWIEEPAVPGNIEVFKRLKEAIRIPLATGERDRTIWGIIPYLQERCIDILQPDVGHTGGISQMKKIATLAEAYSVPLAPHCTASELGLTASLHSVAAIPNFLIQEGYLDGHIMPPGVAHKNWEVDKDGYASLPQGNGLGVEINETLLAEVAANPKKKFPWPTPGSIDGSVMDY